MKSRMLLFVSAALVASLALCMIGGTTNSASAPTSTPAPSSAASSSSSSAKSAATSAATSKSYSPSTKSSSSKYSSKSPSSKSSSDDFEIVESGYDDANGKGYKGSDGNYYYKNNDGTYEATDGRGNGIRDTDGDGNADEYTVDGGKTWKRG